MTAPRTTERYVCPTCGAAVTVAVAVDEPPTCAHRGTTHDAKRIATRAVARGEEGAP